MTGSRWERTESLLAEEARRQAERRELSAKNRRVIAERMGWLLGYVEECEKLDVEFPGYHSLYGATVEDLRSALLAEADHEH